MKIKMTMIDYCKKVLQGVSFDERLLRKEYRKAIRWLQPTELAELKKWIRTNGTRLNRTQLN